MAQKTALYLISFIAVVGLFVAGYLYLQLRVVSSMSNVPVIQSRVALTTRKNTQYGFSYSYPANVKVENRDSAFYQQRGITVTENNPTYGNFKILNEIVFKKLETDEEIGRFIVYNTIESNIISMYDKILVSYPRKDNVVWKTYPLRNNNTLVFFGRKYSVYNTTISLEEISNILSGSVSVKQ